ncbi:glycosyltransferase family 1 protein [Enterobacter hormaechei]|uniref:glycosyltransferase family 4 protein n=1 Tax=Enterobacter hormaechei TaxID=158836 RepID=UPI000D7E5CB3|nr:glycosyltransferase family 1 protein [Enterobacter hormaechei]AWS77503.1 glycosyltransferase family 1 protein [Enterobacter cloacae complex sp.]HCJ7642250.1 glycosyltransferase family 4 protein [Enterobacter hormaechei subsp. xiangfangensis]HDW2128227.1 glycosyltransferase family 4 protein [Enterobacter hormaechei subsp. steigerwaltii]AXO46672.1 glycosyltransferase family 1 protein [Enterobacter hormaechei]EKG3235001.1 glycosyltransferase family 4 protein [Enterobacter hormaechei]
MSKRILVNLLSFSEEKYYGVGVYFRDIVVDALTRLVKENDCKLLILYLENINVKEMFGIIEHDRIDYVAVSGINSKLKRIFFEQIILPLRFKKFDLVYSPNNINPIFSKGLGRSIITIHDLLPFKKCNRFGWFQKKYLKIFTSLSAKTSHKIVTVSNYSLNEIVDYLHVDKNKIVVTYNSSSISYDNLYTKHAKNNNKYFFSVGALQDDKQYDLMIRAFHLFLESNPDYKDFKLFIAGGDHGSKGKLEIIIKDLSMQDQVILLGYVSDGEKYSLYMDCKATLLLGKSEGFGIPVIESMVFEKPIIVSNLGALPEIVGSAGIITASTVSDVANAMRKILEFKCSKDLFTHELERFNLKKQQDKLYNLFKSVIN